MKQGDFDFGGQIHIPFTTFQKVYNQGDNIGWITVTGKQDSYDILQIEKDVEACIKEFKLCSP